MGKFIMGVDIGGTKIASGIIAGDGTLKDSIIVPALAEKGKDVSLNQVYGSIESLIKKTGKKNIKGIGVCAPGPLDPVKGVVHNPPNLPGWQEVPLARLVKRKFGIPAKLENDANAAGMAEMVWGAAKGYKNVFYITVSTGIGTGIIIDGKIYHGKNGMAGEGGHVTVNYDEKGPVCGCGNRGCIESLASGPNTVNRLKKKLKGKKRSKILTLAGDDMKKITMKTVADAARKKDKMAIDAVKEQGKLIGIWLGSMINVLDPGIIVIGGGVSMIGELIFKEIREYAYGNTINIFAEKTPIVRAKLKKHVGIYGAASIMMK